MKFSFRKISLLLIFSLLISSLPVYALEDEGIQQSKLTYEEALEKAIKNSTSLKKTEKNIEINDEQRDAAAAEVVSQRPSGDDIFVTESSNLSALMSVLEKDLQNKSYDLEIEMEKESIGLEVKKSFDEITLLKSQIEISKLALKNAETKLDITQRREKYGLESPYNVRTAQQDYKQKEADLEDLQKDLENTYEEFNILIGLNENERMELENELTFNQLDNINIETYITRMLDKDPSIKIKKQTVEKAQYSLNTYTYSGSSDSYNIRKNKLSQANMDVVDAKDQMEQKIRSAFNEILQLEKEYEMKQLAIQNAEKELETVQKKFEIGSAIQFDMDEAEVSLLNAQLALNQIIVQHEQKRFAFERPYLL